MHSILKLHKLFSFKNKHIFKLIFTNILKIINIKVKQNNLNYMFPLIFNFKAHE